MSNALNIVHEDADLLIVDKPSGLLTVSPPGEERDNLFTLVKEHVRESGRGARGQRRVWIIHRLDKEASGLLVFAKTERAFGFLKEELRQKRVHRLYTVVVEGELGRGQLAAADVAARKGGDVARAAGGAGAGAGAGEVPLGARLRAAPTGTIQSFIHDEEFEIPRSLGVGEVAQARAESARRADRAGRREMGGNDASMQRPPARGVRGRGERAAQGPSEGANLGEGSDVDGPKLAVTHWRAVAYGHGRTLAQCRLETGRKNQIRLHMAEAGHPVVGDSRFGATSDPVGRVALHATELGFDHPSTGQRLRFFSPVPPTFSMLVGGRDKGPDGASADAGPDRDRWLGADLGAMATAARTESAPTDPTARATESSPAPAADTSWDEVASWYDELIEDERSDHFRDVIGPGTLKLLAPRAGMRVLDVACGQGALVRRLTGLGAEAMGVDAAPKLIEAARRREGRVARSRFAVADARALAPAAAELGIDRASLDAITSVMALMNIDPLEPVMRGAAELLKPGGVFVAIILHPAFRSPGQTAWGWETDQSGPRQYRRVDGYLSPGQRPITMNPGFAARGAKTVTTWTFHRPIQTYIRACASAGLLVEAIEEWPSMRSSPPGKTPAGKQRAAEENRIRREIPMFLGLRAVRR